jgi:4-hydroxybenzoate polyprenyltransferase
MLHRFFSLLIPIYLLELVGASAVTALGWAVCRRLHIAWMPSAPLWFSGYLLVYNLDRLHPDPSDTINTPTRTGWSRRLRPYRMFLVGTSVACILAWPLITNRPWLVLALLATAVGLQFYTRTLPVVRFRLKDLPYIKSFIAPTVIAMILVIWPAVEARRPLDPELISVFFWCFFLLAVNSLVFDYRDIRGDRLAGVRTLPVLLGEPGTVILLRLFALVLFGFTVIVFAGRPDAIVMSTSIALASTLLLWSLKRVLTPIQMSFSADLLLFVPALIELWSHVP